MTDAADATFPGDRLGAEMRAICARYMGAAAGLPEPINSCRLHPDALPFARTLNGRSGCVGCLQDPGNLDPSDKGVDGIDVDGGETRCPRCRGVVYVVPNTAGTMSVYDQSGELHTHRITPFGQEARELRRGRPIEEDPSPAPPRRRDLWERDEA